MLLYPYLAEQVPHIAVKEACPQKHAQVVHKLCHECIALLGQLLRVRLGLGGTGVGRGGGNERVYKRALHVVMTKQDCKSRIGWMKEQHVDAMLKLSGTREDRKLAHPAPIARTKVL